MTRVISQPFNVLIITGYVFVVYQLFGQARLRQSKLLILTSYANVIHKISVNSSVRWLPITSDSLRSSVLLQYIVSRNKNQQHVPQKPPSQQNYSESISDFGSGRKVCVIFKFWQICHYFANKWSFRIISIRYFQYLIHFYGVDESFMI